MSHPGWGGFCGDAAFVSKPSPILMPVATIHSLLFQIGFCRVTSLACHWFHIWGEQTLFVPTYEESHTTLPPPKKMWTLLTCTCTLTQAYISMLPHCRITLTRNCRKMDSNLHKIYFDFFIPAWMRSACSIGLIYSVLKRNFYERVHSTLKHRVNNDWVF